MNLSDPFKILSPNERWAPTQGQMDAFQNAYEKLLPPLVYKIRIAVAKWRDEGYQGASETSKSLLNFWFNQEHLIGQTKFSFFFSQREAIESIIYLYEIAKARDKYELVRFDSSQRVSTGMFEETWTRYVIKMATGAGKTKVMGLTLVWSYFHKLYEAGSTLSKDFLVIAPNIIVLNRLRKDFDGLKMFFEEPFFPDNGYDDKDWKNDFQLTLHIQDDLKPITEPGNIFLTNIHRVFFNEEPEQNFETTFLGVKPKPDADTSKGLDLGKILRSDKIKDLVILNDEAHHIHDSSLAWFKSIEDISNKFGVAAKEKLKLLRTTVDSLTLTATPIPRTLQFSLMGARDLSIINTPPPNRQPIQTEVMVFNEDAIRDIIYYETERGGQVFFIHNRVKGLAEMKTLIQGLCPDLSIAFAHGQMSNNSASGKEINTLEDTILDFIDHKYDVLICTNIVESGVDIPNVNTIIINNAHQFGLSDLHQLRGRVGRSNKKAFCYLVAPPMSTLTQDSRKRLTTLEQYSDLGSGFQIAMRDLDIRGAGNLLGGEQSGFITEIGFEMYHKILDEAIKELKRKEFREIFKEEIQQQDNFVSDCTIDTDLEILLPDCYVESITERLSLYSRLDNCETEEELMAFHHELNDRFGPVPPQAEDLFTTVRSRKLAVDMGFEKMLLRNKNLKCFFVGNPESPYFQSSTFNSILLFLQTGTNKAQLKQVGKNGILIVNDINNMQELYTFLNKMSRAVSTTSAD